MGMIRRAVLVAAAALAVATAAGGYLLAAANSAHGGARPGTDGGRDVDNYLPASIVVGPDSTLFTITDESRGRPVRYVCGFTRPTDTGRNTGGTHPLEIYAPAVQCNRG